jgi:hypothetical protein
MRNPLRSEAEAFRFLIVVIIGAVIVVAAAYVNTWLGVAAAVLVVGGVCAWLLGGPKAARPPVLVSGTPGGGHRVLLVANPGSAGVQGRLGDGVTDVVVVVPALASTVQSLTGAVDGRRAEAEATANALAGELGDSGVRARAEVGADDPLLAIADALRTFGADEIVLVNTDDALLAEARDRFALPISQL